MKKWLVVISLMYTCAARTQVLHSFLSETYNSGVAYSRQGTDGSSFLVNPAALPALKKGSIAFYSEQKFLLKELRGGHAALAFPAAGGGIGVAFGVAGSEGYSNGQAALAYGRALSKQINLGVQINYHLVHAAGYGNTSAVGFELGLIIHATDKLFSGIRIVNPAGGKFTRHVDDQLPAGYTMVLGWEPSENLILCMQVKKTEDQPVNILFSLQYNFMHQFFVRTGIATSSSHVFAGFGLEWKNFRIDLAGAYHLQLGATPALQLIMQLQKGGP